MKIARMVVSNMYEHLKAQGGLSTCRVRAVEGPLQHCTGHYAVGKKSD